MTKKQKEIHIGSIKKFLLQDGWREDPKARTKIILIKTDFLGKMRLVFNKTKLRKERSYPSGWRRMASAYYKDMKIEACMLIGIKI